MKTKGSSRSNTEFSSHMGDRGQRAPGFDGVKKIDRGQKAPGFDAAMKSPSMSSKMEYRGKARHAKYGWPCSGGDY